MEAAPEPRPLSPGTMLDDRYRIERLLAVGGMGAVYEGTHVKLRKRVAIKLLNRALTTPAMIERFHREAITASQIGHEGIAQVTDLGTSATGEHFLVMEYLEGEPLSARLKGPLPIEVACELGCAILSPLAAAHAAGIVHRDLKPDNVFLVKQSRGEMVKLLDFGISRAQGLEKEFKLTTTGLVLGTPYYMSPEQARGETSTTAQADIYAFGVILYEMLIGTVPIKADNYNALIYKVMTAEYARPHELRPEIPLELEAIVLRAMALEPHQRWQSAAELERALLVFCRPTFRDHMIERISSSHVGFKASSPLMPAPTPKPADATVVVSNTSVDKKASRAVVPIVIASIAAAGIAIAVIVSSGGGETEAPKPAEPAAKVEPAPVIESERVEPPPVVEPTPEPVEPVIEKVTIRFDIEPPNAAITVDGKSVEAKLEIEKDDREHDLRITARGFQPYEEKLMLDENQKLVIKLDKVGTKPKPRTPKPGQKTGKPEHIDTKSPYDN